MAPPHKTSPWTLIAQHSTALLALVYLFSAIAGTTYHFFLFRHFGLDVFDFWELADFLVSGVREPLTLVFALLAVVVSASIVWNEQFYAWASQRGPVARFFFGNTINEWLGMRARNYPLLGILIGMLFFAVLVEDLAGDQARAIEKGRDKRILIYPGPDGSDYLRAGLISRTYGLVVVVAAASGDRYALPIESVDAIGLCGESSWEECTALYAPAATEEGAADAEDKAGPSGDTGQDSDAAAETGS